MVDDVADTGETLALVVAKCATAVADQRSAVLYTKPRSVVVPDYSWADTDAWIEFPWSSRTALTS